MMVSYIIICTVYNHSTAPINLYFDKNFDRVAVLKIIKIYINTRTRGYEYESRPTFAD